MNIASGGIVKSFFKELLDMEKSGRGLDAVEIQKELTRNIANLDKINSLPPLRAATEFNKLIDRLTQAYYAGKLTSQTNQ